MRALSFSNLSRVLALTLACAVSGSVLTGCVVARGAKALVSSPREVPKLTNPIDKSARLAVLWIGHATALVQMDDKVILTDPVFASSVGQLSKRLVEPGLDPKNLPPVDAVLISHMHVDHLSLGSLDTIESKIRMMLMPPGGVTYLTDFGFPVIELRPWQGWEKDGLRVTAVPVDHAGWRYGLDYAWMKHAFTGYVVEYHGMKVYFGGDTAYDQKLFVETAQRFPGIDLALLPIGPIEPHDFMRHLHMDPREAVQAFFDLGAKRMVPIHYDTFQALADEPGEALRGLQAAKKRWALGPEIAPLAIGERRVFLKQGEGPAVESPKSKTDDSWSKPATPSGKPAPAPPSKPAPKSDIPDDDKLD
jgi:L-ascorbate metabolism protein UlaG (beta-lactamase superfamily)